MVLWTAFTAYVLYACAELRFSIMESQTGRQSTRKRSAAIYPANVGPAERPYAERLSCLSALSLECSRDLADLLNVYKIIHGLVGLSMDEAGISLQIGLGVTRSSGLRLLVLRARTVKSNLISSRPIEL